MMKTEFQEGITNLRLISSFYDQKINILITEISDESFFCLCSIFKKLFTANLISIIATPGCTNRHLHELIIDARIVTPEDLSIFKLRKLSWRLISKTSDPTTIIISHADYLSKSAWQEIHDLQTRLGVIFILGFRNEPVETLTREITHAQVANTNKVSLQQWQGLLNAISVYQPSVNKNNILDEILEFCDEMYKPPEVEFADDYSEEENLLTDIELIIPE